MLRRVSNPGGTPTISGNISIAVAATARRSRCGTSGISAGTNGQLDGGDDRLTSASLVNGRLWTAHTIGVTHTGAGERDRRPATACGGTRLRIADDDAVGRAVRDALHQCRLGQLRPAQLLGAVDRDLDGGRTVIGFSAAGTSEYVNAGVAERFSSDAAGTLRAPQLFTAPNDAYNPPGDAGSPSRGRRWGGVSATVVDGCDGSTIWTVQQFTDAANSYGLAGRPHRRPGAADAGQRRRPSVIAERRRVDQPPGDGDVERRHGLLRLRAPATCAGSARSFPASSSTA